MSQRRAGLFNALSEWWVQHLAQYATYNLSNTRVIGLKTLTEDLINCYRDLEIATFPYIGKYGTLLIYTLSGLLYPTNRRLVVEEQKKALCYST